MSSSSELSVSLGFKLKYSSFFRRSRYDSSGGVGESTAASGPVGLPAAAVSGNVSSAYARSLRRTSAGAKVREGTKFTTVDHGLKSVREQYSRSRGPPFVRPNSRRAFGHSNTRSTTPSPPRICACEGASKQVDQRGTHAVRELQLSRHNAVPPTCVSQSSQTDERRRARRGERTETHTRGPMSAHSGTSGARERTPAEQP